MSIEQVMSHLLSSECFFSSINEMMLSYGFAEEIPPKRATSRFWKSNISRDTSVKGDILLESVAGLLKKGLTITNILQPLVQSKSCILPYHGAVAEHPVEEYSRGRLTAKCYDHD